MRLRLEYHFLQLQHPQLFNELDNENICDNYNIAHYGASVTTLEEVFLSVNKEEEDIPKNEKIMHGVDFKQRKLNRQRLLKWK